MRRAVRTIVGFTAAAVVAIACSFTSSGAGGPGSTPDAYEGGLLPDGGIAAANGNSGNGGSNGASSGASNGTSNGSGNGTSSGAQPVGSDD